MGVGVGVGGEVPTSQATTTTTSPSSQATTTTTSPSIPISDRDTTLRLSPNNGTTFSDSVLPRNRCYRTAASEHGLQPAPVPVPGPRTCFYYTTLVGCPLTLDSRLLHSCGSPSPFWHHHHPQRPASKHVRSSLLVKAAVSRRFATWLAQEKPLYCCSPIFHPALPRSFAINGERRNPPANRCPKREPISRPVRNKIVRQGNEPITTMFGGQVSHRFFFAYNPAAAFSFLQLCLPLFFFSSPRKWLCLLSNGARLCQYSHIPVQTLLPMLSIVFIQRQSTISIGPTLLPRPTTSHLFQLRSLLRRSPVPFHKSVMSKSI